MLKKKKWKIKKLMVKTGRVMFSGEIYYYWPLNSCEKVDKIVGKTSFFLCIIYCSSNAVAIMYSRILSVFKAKKWKYVDFNRYFKF